MERERKTIHSKAPGRNRLAKVLPEEWRKFLVDRGCPRRKYTAIVKTTLASGRVIEEMVVEEGWVIALDRDGLTGTFERRIDFNPNEIVGMELIQVI